MNTLEFLKKAQMKNSKDKKPGNPEKQAKYPMNSKKEGGKEKKEKGCK